MTDQDPFMHEEAAHSEQDPPEVQCDVCGKKFLWASDLAGQEITCSCGEKVKFPIDPADAHVAYKINIPPEPPLAELLSARPTLEYQRRQFKPVSAFESDRVKNIIAPIWFLGGGFLISALFETYMAHGHFFLAINSLVINILGETVILMIGMMIAAKTRGINLGSFWTMLLKLAAIIVAPAAICDILRPALNRIPLLGPIVLFIIQVVLFLSFLGMLFNLDEEDAWFCCLIFFAIGGIFQLARYSLGF